MKTTLEISDPLLREARKIAAREHTTLRAIVERGLRHVVQEGAQKKQPYKMPDASFGGSGLTDEFKNASWSEIIEASYDRRND